jgi:quercetin dioxygenase-like cupin family protein
MSHTRVVAYLVLMSPALIFASGQDAAMVNPKVVKVKFENPKFRIFRSRCVPHERLEMHSHPAKAEVQITDGVLRIFTPDGKWLDDPGKAGEFLWREPTRHAVENVGSAPLELIEIEMKNVTAKSIPVGAPCRSETTPSNQSLFVEQEPHHRWGFQNQYVRVLDVLLAHGDSTLFHPHSHDSIAS